MFYFYGCDSGYKGTIIDLYQCPFIVILGKQIVILLISLGEGLPLSTCDCPCFFKIDT